MKTPGFIANILGGKASEIIDSAGGVIDRFVQTKEEKEAAKLEFEKELNRHMEAADTEMTELYALEIKDRENARKREIDIATSDKVPLINKIITPILAMAVILLTFILFYIVLFKQLGTEKDIIIYVLGVLSAATTSILSYYFGSSASSSRKQDQINKMLEK